MKKIHATFVFPALIAIGFLIAAMQPFGESPDYSNYAYFFQQLRFDASSALESRFEPGFVFLAAVLTALVPSDLIVYGLFVIVALTVKFIYIGKWVDPLARRGSYYLGMAILFYAFKFFPLHELTQLRASLSVSMIIAAVFFILNGARISGVAISGVAAAFHYSALILLPFFFLPRLDRRQTILLPLLLAVALHFLSMAAISVAQLYFFVFQTYEYGFPEDAVSLLSPVFFPEYGMLAVSLIYWRHLTELMRRIVALELIGFAIFFGLIDFPVVAVRAREFFSVLWMLFLAHGFALPLRGRCLLHAFVAMSFALAFYQYVILDFFNR